MSQLASPSRAKRQEELLDAGFMSKLDQLDLMSRKILAGKLQGERRSKKKGQSVEFADYRPYVAGDDLRFIDWNLYARMERLFLRLFMEEEDLSVSILIDTTRSMDWGDPKKLTYAKKVAAALAYIGLVNYNRVHLYGFTDQIAQSLPNLRGRRPIRQMLDFLRDLTPPGSDDQTANRTSGVAEGGGAGGGNLEAVVKRFALTQTSKGIVILLSDFFDKGEISQALRYLSGERFDVYALHVLSPQEIDPVKGNLTGDLRLRDIEDDNVAEVSVTPALVKRYKANLQAYCKHLREECSKRQAMYMVSDTSVPFDQLVLQYLRRRGLLG